MTSHDILTLYSAKAIEYLLALAFLLLFVPFWRYVNGGLVAHARTPATETLASRLTGWFQVPSATYFHPGHAWARVEPEGVVTLGIDDFAQKLVGPVHGVRLPLQGARLEQGEPAWSLAADSSAVDMVAPIGGVVVAVNDRARQDPASVNADPYGDGWLLKVRPRQLAPQLATLRSGRAARRWMDAVCEGLSTTLSPSLGLVYQDGGLPVDGIARAVAPEDWTRIARRFLLTDDAPAAAEAPQEHREEMT